MRQPSNKEWASILENYKPWLVSNLRLLSQHIPLTYSSFPPPYRPIAIMRMDYDDVAWEQNDKVFNHFKKNKVTKPHVLLAVINFMAGTDPRVDPLTMSG